jgi:hypothetical protein
MPIGARTASQFSQTEVNTAVFESIIPKAQELAHGSQKDMLSPVAASVASSAFIEIVPKAYESSQAGGRLSAGNVNKNDVGNATYTNQKYVVRPSLSDFVVDVELIARKTLDETEFRYFKRFYLVEGLRIADMRDQDDKTKDGQDKYFVEHLEANYPADKHEAIRVFDKRIREKLGAAFIATGVYPFNLYMNFSRCDVRDIHDARSN